MTPMIPLLLAVAPPALPPTTTSIPADVHLRADANDPNASVVRQAIEDSLAAEGFSVGGTEVADDSARLATVDIQVVDDAVSIRIDDAQSDDAMTRDFPNEGAVSTVAAQESAYVVVAAAVSLRDHGTLTETADATPPRPAPIAVAHPVAPAKIEAAAVAPAVADSEPPPPDPAFPRGVFIESHVGAGVQAWGNHSPLPTLDTSMAAGFEFGKAGARDDLRIALALTAAHDERFSVPATYRGVTRGPIGLYSEWDFMPQLRIGRVTRNFMPYASVAVGPGWQTNNDTDRDRFMVTASVAGGGMWQLHVPNMTSKLVLGVEAGARGSVDAIRPTTQTVRPYVAFKFGLYFGRRD